VFTLPAEVAAIAFQNKAVVYAILFRTVAETLRTIAADSKHLGAGIGLVAVLHSWGQSLHYHPHLHCIVPGGGVSPDGTRWISCRPGFFLPVRVLSRLFRRFFLEQLRAAHGGGRLAFFGDLAHLAKPDAFARLLAEARSREWVVYAKPPFGGPKQVLAYLGRYTHRVAIANSRLIGMEDDRVAFRWKDYRIDGPARWKTMRLHPHEFIRRFLLHVLPKGFHRIRHYGLFAGTAKAEHLATARKLLDMPAPEVSAAADGGNSDTNDALNPPCPCCGARMRIIERFNRGETPRHRPSPCPGTIRIDTS